MSFLDLIDDGGDRRSLDEVLAEINEVLGTEELDDDHSLCLEGEHLCDRCYDEESANLARITFSGRVTDPAVLRWSIDTVIKFRREVLDADRAPNTDPAEWFEQHGLDELERTHIWLECGDDCPVCCGEGLYGDRHAPSA